MHNISASPLREQLKYRLVHDVQLLHACMHAGCSFHLILEPRGRTLCETKLHVGPSCILNLLHHPSCCMIYYVLCSEFSFSWVFPGSLVLNMNILAENSVPILTKMQHNIKSCKDRINIGYQIHHLTL